MCALRDPTSTYGCKTLRTAPVVPSKSENSENPHAAVDTHANVRDELAMF